MSTCAANEKAQVDAAYDVAIVGFGPSGAVAAGLLGARGIRTFVCDRARDVYDKPRAIALDHEITRLFQNMGVATQIKPYLEPFTDSVFYGVDDQIIKRMSTVAEPFPLAHTPSVVFTQPPVERILRAHAASFPSVTIALGQQLLSLSQDKTGVALGLQDETGRPSTVRARYLVGCDGASSTVRTLTGMALEDLGFDEPWLVVDVLLNEQGLSKLPTTSVQYCHPDRPATMVIGPGRHRRWEISINPGEDPEQLATPEGTWKLLAPWISPADGELWRQASYRFHALVAEDWRKGNVFIAGDAAHQQPPFLGQGMCQGVRDVNNLCWKLDAVLKGTAPDSLLDSYTAERKGHVTELTTRIKAIGKIIGERDVNKARVRDALLLEACGGVVKPVPRQDVQPALQAGLLSAVTHPRRGTLFPQPWLLTPTGERRRMDDAIGTGWRIVLAAHASLAMQQAAAASSAIEVRVVQLGTPALTEADGLLAQWFAAHNITAAIVRPDHYVHGVCEAVDELNDQLGALNAKFETAHATT
jgi:3-(3-hydroxy-phenyl)propionate hydroxylase